MTDTTEWLASKNTPMYQYAPGIIPSMDHIYRWDGWTDAGINVNNLYIVDINKDNRPDIVAHFWQSVINSRAKTDEFTPNRLIILEQQEDGTYKDTTSLRFNTLDPVVLGKERGGVGVADFGDINDDGLLDMTFALNRDDGRSYIDWDTGTSYPTSILSTPEGGYVIQEISTPAANYFMQLIDVGDHYEVWINQNGYADYGHNYGNESSGTTIGMPTYSFDKLTNSWSLREYAPLGSPFNVLPEQIAEGRVNQVMLNLWDTSSSFDVNLGADGAYARIPRPALMKRTADNEWEILFAAETYDYQVATYSFNGALLTGLVSSDEDGYFALVEYLIRPGSFEIYPGSGSVVLTTRSMTTLDKDLNTDTYIGKRGATKLEFFLVNEASLEKIPITIVDEQKDLSSWSYRFIDFNRDGLTDIVVEGSHSWLGFQEPASGAPAVYLNTGAGVFVHLSEDLFPRAPERWVKYSASSLIDVNGDNIYDLLYFPTIASEQFNPYLDWPLYIGVDQSYEKIYTKNITITNRIGSSLIKTQAGNDTISDLNAADGATLIDGGLGLDIVKYETHSSTIILRRDLDYDWELKFPNQSRSDKLENIERISFADVSIGLDTDGNGGTAYRLCQAAYDRTPDPEGLGFWIHYLDGGFDLVEAANNFLKSNEFVAIYGTDPTSEQYVYLLYKHVHHREPDASGLQFWIDAMYNKDGAFGKQWSKGEILLKFSESNENIVNLAGVMENGFVYLPYEPGP